MKPLKIALISTTASTLCAVVTEMPFDQASALVPIIAAATWIVHSAVDWAVERLHPESDLTKIARRQCPNCDKVYMLKELTSDEHHVHLRCSNCDAHWLLAPGERGIQAFRLAPPAADGYDAPGEPT